MSVREDCTEACEAMPECSVCHQRKQPHGRSAPLGAYYCDWDCAGYSMPPRAGHLWPGELARARKEEGT